MKKFFLSAAFALLCFGAFAQNVQLHYDFGHNAYNKEGGKDLRSRAYLTTTVEMFKPDSFGSTFFFVDMDYVSRNNPGTTRGVVGAYCMIAIYFLSFSQRSSQLKKVRCHRIPFCGLSTQWFSSGKMSNSAGMPRMRAALKAPMPWLTLMR